MRKLSLASVLFSGIQQRLLSTLLLHPQRQFYATELANDFGVSSSSLQRDLAKFTQTGILKMFRHGNRTYFQGNQACPVFLELRGLLIKTSGLVDVIYHALKPQASEIEVAVVYGSIAAGTDTSGSDIDLLVMGSVRMIELSPLLAQAEEILGRPINTSLYTPGEFRQKAARGHFIQSIFDKPLLFIIGVSSDLEAINGRESRRGGADKPKRNRGSPRCRSAKLGRRANQKIVR